MPITYRQQRDTLAESLETRITYADREALLEAIGGTDETVTSHYFGFDERVEENIYMVRIDGEPVGFANTEI